MANMKPQTGDCVRSGTPGVCFSWLIATAVLTSAKSHAAERVFSELSFGREETATIGQGAEVEWRNSLLVKTNSSELPRYERRTPTFVSGLKAYGLVGITDRITASAEPYAALVRAEESETEDGPATKSSTENFAYGGRFSLFIAAENQLEFGAAGEVRSESEQTIKRDNAGLDSTTTTAGYTLFRPGFVLKKRHTQWTAGAYYELGDDEKLKITTKVLDDTRVTTGYATLPPRFGGFFDIGVGSNMRLGTELSLIRGSASSLKSGSDEVFDDSYRAAFHLLIGDKRQSSIWVGLAHQTLAYASQNYVAFENIPVTELEVTWNTASGWMLGGLLSFSEDTQSTAEINRDFLMYGFGLRAGLRMPNP
jgi:hypothetical protein